ncbi:peroxiredoxin-like family protein [Paenibacillus nasutitermitis]|uniref:thioredoxin-dependent peroxiredoxin n=1 Tax=Paenibacillus nasutitermitis TaxID=1652958 RepID=A0A916ZGX3_9BACL|nr:peroxiredoxin-like family protein [Paenibacillus nasutitermitis]GGD97369.1 peroxiredoxin [Paenibacillus nasutitermitis]
MENLNEQLAVMEENLKTVIPLEAYRLLQQSLENLQQSGVANGLQVGDQAPDFTLKNALGSEINFYQALNNGPVILSFYRGGWCPYCNLQLRALQAILPRFRELGANLIAVSPQSPDNTIGQQEKERFGFSVLSDNNGHVASQFHVLYEVPEAEKNVLQGFGRNLLEYNATNRWILPVPSTFVIDSRAVIRFAHANSNFMRRVEPEIILQVLRGVLKDGE